MLYTMRLQVLMGCVSGWHGDWMYLVKVGGDESDGITGSCHLDETAEDSVPHWGVFIHAMKQVTQPGKSKYTNVLTQMGFQVFETHAI